MTTRARRMHGPSRLTARSWFALFTVAGVVSATSQACRSATQVTLAIETAAPCSEINLKSVAIVVGGDPLETESKVDQRFVTATTTECIGQHVGTLVITPPDDGARGSVIVIAGIDRAGEECTPSNGYKGCIVARRTFSFVDHVGLTLPVRLDLDCKDVACDALSTCKSKSCVSSTTTCTGDDCSTFGVSEDGGAAYADVTSPPLDGESNDASGDGPTNDGAVPPAGGCTAKTQVPCLPGAASATSCTPDQRCCRPAKGAVTLPTTPMQLDGSIPTPQPADAEALDAGTESTSFACRVASACSTAKGASFACIGATNCPGDQVCCQSNSMTTECGTSCESTTGQLCTDDCECPSKQCLAEQTIQPTAGVQLKVRYCKP